jgi:hypothetical protein
MMKNKQGVSPITVIFWYLGFIVVWIFYAGKVIKYWALEAVATNALTGIEAFLLTNINVLVFFISLVFMIAILAVSD